MKTIIDVRNTLIVEYYKGKACVAGVNKIGGNFGANFSPSPFSYIQDTSGLVHKYPQYYSEENEPS